MNPTKLLKWSVAGTIIAALCCFTPVLVVLLSAVGLSALTGHLDIVLLPALFFFILLTAYALYRQYSGDKKPRHADTPSNTEINDDPR